MPALAAPLLYPLAPLGLVAPRTTAGRLALVTAACLPTVLWLGLLAVAVALGLASAVALQPGKAAVLALTLDRRLRHPELVDAVSDRLHALTDREVPEP